MSLQDAPSASSGSDNVRGRAARGSDALAVLGGAWFERAGDVAAEVLQRWQMHGRAVGASEDVYRDVVRTTELSTVALSHFLMTGSFPTREESQVLASTGK